MPPESEDKRFPRWAIILIVLVVLFVVLPICVIMFLRFFGPIIGDLFFY